MQLKKLKKRKKRRPELIAFDRAWTWFSLFIRYRDSACITCGKNLPGRDGEAGHFVHKSRTSALYFDEFNVHKQCFRCNRMLSGNLRKYSDEIIKRYGIEKFNDLNKRSYTLKKWKLDELLKIENRYKKEVELQSNGENRTGF